MDQRATVSHPQGPRSVFGHVMAILVILILMIPILANALEMVVPAEVLSSGFGILKPPLAASISIGSGLFFFLIVLIWFFDSIGFVTLRHSWQVRAIWTGGIATVLATSVTLYRSALAIENAPLEGVWHATARYGYADSAEHTVTVAYVPEAKSYLAQSDIAGRGHWFSVTGLTDTSGTVSVFYTRGVGRIDSIPAGTTIAGMTFKDKITMITAGIQPEHAKLTFKVANDARQIEIGNDTASVSKPYLVFRRGP